MWWDGCEDGRMVGWRGSSRKETGNFIGRYRLTGKLDALHAPRQLLRLVLAHVSTCAESCWSVAAQFMAYGNGSSVLDNDMRS